MGGGLPDVSYFPAAKTFLVTQNVVLRFRMTQMTVRSRHIYMGRVGMEAEIKEAFMMTNRDFFFSWLRKKTKKHPQVSPQ